MEIMRLVLFTTLLFCLEANAMLLRLFPNNSQAKQFHAALRVFHNVSHKCIKDCFPKIKDEEIDQFMSTMLQAGLNPYTVAKTFSMAQLNIKDIDEKAIQESIPSHYADFIINPHKNKKEHIVSVIREQRLACMVNSRRLKALSLSTFDTRMMAMYMVMQDCNPYEITNENMQEAIQHLKLVKALLKGLNKHVKDNTNPKEFANLNEYVKDNINSKELEWADQRAMDEIWLLPTIDRLLNSNFKLGTPITDEVIDSLKNSIPRPNGPLILKIYRKKMQKLSLYCSNTNYTKLVKENFPNSGNDDIEMFIALMSSIDLNPTEVAKSLNNNGVIDISLVNESNIKTAVNPKRYYDFTYFNLEIDDKETEVIRSIRNCLLFKITSEIEKIIPNISHLEAKVMSMYIMINNQYPQLEMMTDEDLEEAQRFTSLICSLYRNLSLYVKSITESKRIHTEALMRVQDLIWLFPTVDHLFDCGYRLDTKLTERIINALKKGILNPQGQVVNILRQSTSMDCF